MLLSFQQKQFDQQSIKINVMTESTTIPNLNMKPIAPRIYQSTKIVKDHYSKVMRARPAIDTKVINFKSIGRTTDPLKIYDLVHENKRICSNLIKIEQSPCYLQAYNYMAAVPKSRKSRHRKRKGRSISMSQRPQSTNTKKTLISEFMKKEQHNAIVKQNHNMIKRLENVRSTLGGGNSWQARERKLSSYSKISRKRVPENVLAQNNIELEQFQKFRKTLILDGKKGAFSGHHSTRTRKRNRKCSSVLTGHRTIAII